MKSSLALTLVFVVALVACQAEAPPAATSTPAAPPAAVPAPAGSTATAAVPDVRAGAQRRRDQRQRWWSRPDVATRLGLDAQTQADLDAILERSQTQRSSEARAAREARERYNEAMRSGDLAAARSAAEARATHNAKMQLAQQVLLIDLLARLDPEQRRIAIEEYDRRLRRSANDAAGPARAPR
jgi:hypothetical protein